jgi:hypothetical protein
LSDRNEEYSNLVLLAEKKNNSVLRRVGETLALFILNYLMSLKEGKGSWKKWRKINKRIKVNLQKSMGWYQKRMIIRKIRAKGRMNGVKSLR